MSIITHGYINYEGHYAVRTFTPLKVWFGKTEWHPEPQLLLTAYDHDRGALRDFAFDGFVNEPTKVTIAHKISGFNPNIVIKDEVIDWKERFIKLREALINYRHADAVVNPSGSSHGRPPAFKHNSPEMLTLRDAVKTLMDAMEIDLDEETSSSGNVPNSGQDEDKG